jgi:23S rRNA pseudouridine2605 synthase
MENLSGLILLSNDASWRSGCPTELELGRLRKGIRLEDGMTAPARVRVLEKLKKNAWVEIELHEGRNREVRRMFEALSYFVGKLIRVRIGNVEFGQARPGRDSSVDAH